MSNQNSTPYDTIAMVVETRVHGQQEEAGKAIECRCKGENEFFSRGRDHVLHAICLFV